MTSDQLQYLVQTAQQLSLARNLDSIMDIVRKAARKLTGAEGATFVLKDDDLCYYAEEDAISPLWKGQRFPMSTCISGWAMIHQEPAVVEDIYQDDRIPVDAYKPTFVKSLVTVPIRTVDPVGAIGIYWAKQHLASEEEVQLLQSLADLTSVSMENVYVYQDLENRIQQRTTQLEAANKELEAFVYSASHDLRAPLRTVQAYTDILLEDYESKLDKEGRTILDNINTAATRMETLIQELLKLSKLGRKKVKKEEVDMSTLTRSVVEELQKEAPPETDIDISKLHSVSADQHLIYQVLFNLIGNAIKYSSKEKDPRVHITSTKENGEIIFSVKDNGAGFDMQYADKLFDVFQRLHSDSEFEGTGIGLALVERIVKNHGGRVWAEGKPNEGATFCFALPTSSSK